MPRGRELPQSLSDRENLNVVIGIVVAPAIDDNPIVPAERSDLRVPLPIVAEAAMNQNYRNAAAAFEV